jgi:hypothetical protein
VARACDCEACSCGATSGVDVEERASDLVVEGVWRFDVRVVTYRGSDDQLCCWNRRMHLLGDVQGELTSAEWAGGLAFEGRTPAYSPGPAETVGPG